MCFGPSHWCHTSCFLSFQLGSQLGRAGRALSVFTLCSKLRTRHFVEDQMSKGLSRELPKAKAQDT